MHFAIMTGFQAAAASDGTGDFREQEANLDTAARKFSRRQRADGPVTSGA